MRASPIFLALLLCVLPSFGWAQSALGNPGMATAVAPEVYKVRFATTEGKFVVRVKREWAPQAADRFYNLVKIGFYDDTAFFRVLDGFMVQFGLHGDPIVSNVWKRARLPDDPPSKSNLTGWLSFAMSGPETRTTQVFINYADNTGLDKQGFVPFGKVVLGMEIVQGLYAGYGDSAPRGAGPDQRQIELQGTHYLKENFPELDWIETATVLE